MRPLFYIVFSLIIVGCSHEQTHNNLLAKAEQTVFEHPDSVVGMLIACWSDTTMTESDKALFGLLYTEALHRSGLSTGTDSLILFSRHYYDRIGDKQRLARALLHHAIILYRQQQTHEAVLTMKQSEKIAERLDFPAFKWYLYSVLGDVNDNVSNYSLTLRYYKQALAEAHQCNNEEWIVRTLNNIAMTFDMLGESDSLLYYTRKAAIYAPKTEGEIRATYLVNQASYSLSTGKRKDAKEWLLQSQAFFPTDRGMKLLADIYLQEGDTAAACEQWYHLINSFSPEVSIQSYRQLISYLESRGDINGVAEYSQRLNSVYNSLYENSDAASIIDLQTQYDEQQRERRQYTTTIILLAAIIFLIVAAIIILGYSRRRIDLLNARFAESQQQYNLTRSELTMMRRQKEREQRENSRQLKDTVSRLHTAASKGKPANDDDVNALAQISFAQSPKLQQLLSVLNSREQTICLLTRQNFQPTEIATLTLSTPQTITNTRVRLLKKLFNQAGGAKDFDNAIKAIVS
ncbi:MAG: hypothetical protein IJ604_14560 [Prevotella sp.]|nr:hypothetical protein [Prevotella sp.]